MILLFLTSISVYPELVGFTADYYDPDYKDKTAGGKMEAKKSAGEVKNYNLWPEAQCNPLNLDFMFNAFDDQYKGCEDVLETHVMPKILTLEKSINLAFGAAWNRAEEQWNRLKPKLRIPPGFQDEFGVAITVYTTDWPEGDPIYKAFNRNVSLAGKSREDYMLIFHYKALHFYITRALQLMKKNSRKRHTAYRGTDKTFEVSETFLRFGRFTSSSLNIEVAKAYHGGLFFEITTCFGVDIHKISSYPKEQEVLIPVAEKFHYVKKEGSFYILNSTCELCSYFNCAYLGEEKWSSAVCSSVV
ncbi:ecto-ADP-ribosyltransferase 5-like [Rana temporaria]|uniref:ecto-ADP-ribosyltransferase 5-like n=1 Tax=Rana temporaria TaxID=8407 RepID=UPI001AADC445|nr:ecto-ADP-ribosyltransferase 5-like [Rana temporaria]